MKNEDLDRHITSLGLKTYDGYQTWCRENGFSTSFNKSQERFDKERKYALDQRAISQLRKSNNKPSLIGFLEQIKEAIPKEWKKPLASKRDSSILDVFTGCHSSPFLGDFPEFLLYLEKKSKLLTTHAYIMPLWQITTWKNDWLRPYTDWAPKSHNITKQFSSLVRHLLAKYDVPLFMDSAWFSTTQVYLTSDNKPIPQYWFYYIGSGNNIRTAEHLPILVTKKIAHWFLQAPESYTINEAFRWAQVKSWGGSDRLIRALRPTKIMPLDKNRDEFVQGLIQFFVKNPMLDMVQVQPIVDYIWNQKYEINAHFPERGVLRRDDPPQPNFSMAGRTVDSLIGQVERWHRQLGKEKKGGVRQWEHHKDIHNFEYEEGKNPDIRLWRIEELLTSAELSQEGRAHNHCVSSYAGSCVSGSSSVWSLSMDNFNGKQRLVTIEVDRNKKINQVRGKNNRGPNSKEMSVITRWCRQENLSQYLG